MDFVFLYCLRQGALLADDCLYCLWVDVELLIDLALGCFC